MKKLIILTTILVFGTTLVFAKGSRFGRGFGLSQGYGPGYCVGYSYGVNFHGPTNQLTEEYAKNAVEKILKANFKGYTIKGVEKFRVPRGTIYEINVTDTVGNTFKFRVNPWGSVRGPFPIYNN
ncbi:PepSY domain-containing protein [Deferribacter abyssi]|uniref:PepSY domain-containing protein n=1 Tax=Deferribacter abyssi TaxID=213806 RepID=UPI003C2529E4